MNQRNSKQTNFPETSISSKYVIRRLINCNTVIDHELKEVVDQLDFLVRLQRELEHSETESEDSGDSKLRNLQKLNKLNR